jgi:hypothetical protein
MATVTMRGGSVKGSQAIPPTLKIGQRRHRREFTANMGATTMENADIKGSVTNNATVKEAANVAIGKNTTANMGSVTIKTPTLVEPSCNTANVQKSANVAIGENSTASMGSVAVE